MLDLKKYNGKKFSKNSFIDKRIKALFLFYDKRVGELKLDYKGKIDLLNHMISVLVESEEYELAAAFKQRKIHKWKKLRKSKRKWSLKLFFRFYRFKIRLLFKMKRD